MNIWKRNSFLKPGLWVWKDVGPVLFNWTTLHRKASAEEGDESCVCIVGNWKPSQSCLWGVTCVCFLSHSNYSESWAGMWHMGMPGQEPSPGRILQLPEGLGGSSGLCEQEGSPKSHHEEHYSLHLSSLSKNWTVGKKYILKILH